MRPHRVTEQRRVATTLEPVTTSLLDIGPPRRELRRATDLVVDDRAVPHRRADDLVPACTQHIDERPEHRRLDDELGHTCVRHPTLHPPDSDNLL